MISAVGFSLRPLTSCVSSRSCPRWWRRRPRFDFELRRVGHSSTFWIAIRHVNGVDRSCAICRLPDSFYYETLLDLSHLRDEDENGNFLQFISFLDFENWCVSNDSSLFEKPLFLEESFISFILFYFATVIFKFTERRN